MAKVLVALSEWGYWGEELVGPLEALDAQGYETVFMTPRGRRPRALPPSMEAGYFDPPLDKIVTDEYYARKTREIDSSARLASPINLSKWFPERPYFNASNFGHALEQYHSDRAESWKQLEEYDALLIVGGSGPIVDMANNQRLHDVILGFYEPGQADRGRVLRRRLPGLRPRLDRAQEHHLGQARHRPLPWSTTTRTAPASSTSTSTWARRRTRWSTSCATRPAPTVSSTAASARRDRRSSTTRSCRGRSTPDSRLAGEKMVEVLEQRSAPLGLVGASSDCGFWALDCRDWCMIAPQSSAKNQNAKIRGREQTCAREPAASHHRAVPGRRHQVHVRQPRHRRAGLPRRARAVLPTSSTS